MYLLLLMLYIDDIDIDDKNIYDANRCVYSTNSYKAVGIKLASHFIHIQERCLSVSSSRGQHFVYNITNTVIPHHSLFSTVNTMVSVDST